MLDRENKNIESPRSSLVNFFVDYYKSVILYYLLAIKKEREYTWYLVIKKFFTNVIDFVFDILKKNWKLTVNLNKKTEEAYSYVKDVDKEVYNLLKYLREFEEEIIKDILTYDELEKIKREIYKTGNIQKVVSDYFKNIFFEKFKSYLINKKRLEESLVKNYLKILDNHWLILSKRIKSKTKWLPYNKFKFGFNGEEVFYFNRELLFSGKWKKDNLFCKWVELMIQQRRNLHILLLDIDDFKAVNSIFSHVWWDIILGNIMKLFNEYYSENEGLWFRYGWEEFILVFEDSDKLLKFFYFIYSKIGRLFLFNFKEDIFNYYWKGNFDNSKVILRFVDIIKNRRRLKKWFKTEEIIDIWEYKIKVLYSDKDGKTLRVQFYEKERGRYISWTVEILWDDVFINLNVTYSKREIKDLDDIDLVSLISILSSEITNYKSIKKKKLRIYLK